MGCSSSKDPQGLPGNQEQNIQNENTDRHSSMSNHTAESVNTHSPDETVAAREETDPHSHEEVQTQEEILVGVSDHTATTNQDDMEQEDSQLYDEEWRKYAEEQKRELLLEKVRVATDRRDRYALENTLPKCNKYRELKKHKDVIRATRILDRLIARDDLREAVHKRSVDDIEKQLENIKAKGYSKVLQQDVIDANIFLEMLWREHSNQEVIIPLDKKTMTEIRRYQSPPAMMHRVIQAAMLLLGEDEYTTQEWLGCQRLMNPQGNLGLSRKFYNFNITDVHPEICARVKYILLEEMFDTRTGQPVVNHSNSKKKKKKEEEEISEEDKKRFWRTYDIETLQKVSPTAVPFYVWCMGVIEEYEENYGEDFENVEPATKSRQLQIFEEYESYKYRTPMEPPQKAGTYATPIQDNDENINVNGYYDYVDREN